MRNHVVVLAAVGLLVMVSGCSSSGSNAKSTSQPPVTSSSGSSTTGAGTNADQSLANKIVLQASDLPGTWVPGPTQPNDKSDDAQITKCLGIPNSDTSQTAYTGSPQFSQRMSEVYSQTTVYTSEGVVESDLRGADAPQLPKCIADSAQGSGATNVHIAKVAMPSSAGTTPGFHITGSFDVSTPQGVRHIVLDEVALTKGRVEVNLNTSEVGAPIPSGLVDHATRALAQRLNATVS
jgi:hypothetical protein